jgi:hypothetical protein
MGQITLRSSTPIDKSQDAIRKSCRIKALIALAPRGQSGRIAGEQISRPDSQPAGRYGSVELIRIRRTGVRRFLYRPQDRSRRPETIQGGDPDERTQLFEGQLLDALPLRRRDTLEAAKQIVRHFNSKNPLMWLVPDWPTVHHLLTRRLRGQAAAAYFG